MFTIGADKFATPINSPTKQQHGPPLTNPRKRVHEMDSGDVTAKKTKEITMMTDRQILEELMRDMRDTTSRLVKLESRFCAIDLQLIEDGEKIEKLVSNEKIQESKIKYLENELERMKREAKNNNIVIHGLQKDVKTHPFKLTTEFIKNHLKADPSLIAINSIRPIRKRDSTSLVLSLGSFHDKKYLFSHVRNLAGKKFSLEDDLTQQQQHQKGIMLMKRRELLDNGAGKLIKVYVNTMCVDGTWFELQDDGNVVKRKSVNPSLPPGGGGGGK
jgi:hypothetical protein